MKTTSGMRRLKTTMMVIAALFVMSMGSVAVKPVVVLAANEFTVTPDESEYTVDDTIDITVKEGSSIVSDATLSANPSTSVSISGQNVTAIAVGNVTIDAAKEGKSGTSGPIKIIPKITASQNSISVNADGTEKTIIKFGVQGADPGDCTWACEGDQLPESIKLGSSSGELSGNPKAADAGTYNLKIKVTADVGGIPFESNPFDFVLTVTADAPSISTTMLDGGVVGTEYTKTIDCSGSPDITWSKTAGDYPPGVNFDKGSFSGTPTTAGKYSFTLDASNGIGTGASQPYEVSIKPVIKTASFTGVVGTAFTGTLETTGLENETPASITWAIPTTQLTGEWTLEGNQLKRITTPTVPETKTFTDVTATVGGVTSDPTDITVTISASAKPVEKVEIKGAEKVSTGGNIELEAVLTPANASNQNVSWSLSGATSGTSLSPNSGLKVIFTGGDHGTVTVTATSAEGKSSTKTITIKQSGSPVITTDNNLGTETNGKKINKTLTATGVTQTSLLEWTIPDNAKKTTLETEYGIDLSSSGVLSGTLKKEGTIIFTVQVKNKDNSETDTKEFTLKVEGKAVKTEIAFPGDSENLVTKVESSNFDTVARDKLIPSAATADTTIALNVSRVTNSSDKSTVDGMISSLFNGLISKSGKVKTIYFNINVSRKQGSSSAEFISDTTSVIETKLTVAKEVVEHRMEVVRNHTGTGGKGLETLKPLDSPPSSFADGTYYVDKTNNAIYLYSRYYSTYAIAYTTVPAYRVTFDSRGGSAVESVMVEGNQYLTAPAAPSRTGYTFDGWYTDSALNNAFSFSGTRITADTTLYAKWTSANSNTETTTNTTPSRNGLSPANSPQTSDPIDYIRVFAALIVLGAGLVVVLGLKAKK